MCYSLRIELCAHRCPSDETRTELLVVVSLENNTAGGVCTVYNFKPKVCRLHALRKLPSCLWCVSSITGSALDQTSLNNLGDPDRIENTILMDTTVLYLLPNQYDITKTLPKITLTDHNTLFFRKIDKCRLPFRVGVRVRLLLTYNPVLSFSCPSCRSTVSRLNGSHGSGRIIISFFWGQWGKSSV